MLAAITLFALLYIFLIDKPRSAKKFDDIAFDTGDIILFHSLDNINAICIASYFTHIGVVYILDGEPMLFEAAHPSCKNLPQGRESGIVLSNLKNRVQTYCGYVFHKRFYGAADDESFVIFMKYALQNMYYDTEIARNFVNKLIFGDNLHNGVNCGELAYLSLIALKILPKKYLYENRKYHLFWLSRISNVPNTDSRYDPPIYVTFESFLPLHPARHEDLHI